MVVGDPHVMSLKSGREYETCSQLQYFEGEKHGEFFARRRRQVPEPTAAPAAESVNETLPTHHVAMEKVLLLSNEWVNLEGSLARWSHEVNGTFISDVSILCVWNAIWHKLKHK